MPANVLDYIDHSLRVRATAFLFFFDHQAVINGSFTLHFSLKRLQPPDPIIGDDASEQIYNEHIAACHELYDYDLSLQRALADK